MPAVAIANPPYAGGHCDVTHVDVGVLRHLEYYGCKSLLDVGCGPGGQVRAAQERGWRAVGIDVDLRLYRQPGVLLGDLAVAPIILPEPADVVWSIEVAEHIPVQFIDNYITTLVQNIGRWLIMTCNQKPGPLHVSCHPPEWWERRIMAASSLVPRPDMMSRLLEFSTMQREFLRETGRCYGLPQR